MMVKRIFIYLNEMFPITAFIGTIFTAVSIELVYLRLFNLKPGFTPNLFLPGIFLTAISLLIRIMDEFKDYHDDLVNFPHRPLPSGKVRSKDLKVLAGICVFSAFFVSLSSLKLTVWSLITLTFTGLMLKWFFVEAKMRKSLPLAFISHHPIVLFNFTYLILSCSQMFNNVDPSKWYYILPLCTVFTNWEIVRKIRAPEQETSYTTYSKIWGPRTAALVAFILQIIFNVTVIFIMEEFHGSLILEIIYILVQFSLSFSLIRFLITLKLPSPLRPVAEGQILMVIGFLFIAALL